MNGCRGAIVERCPRAWWTIEQSYVLVRFWCCLIYACQDIDFDRHIGIHSFPQRFGVAAALYTSIACHVAMVALLIEAIRLEHLGWIAIAGLVVMAALLAYEHSIVTPKDLSRLNAAFFNVNGYISMIFFLTWGADIVRNRFM